MDKIRIMYAFCHVLCLQGPVYDVCTTGCSLNKCEPGSPSDLPVAKAVPVSLMVSFLHGVD